MNSNTLIEARLIYTFDIILWIVRLLPIFTINKTLGPYVEMIYRTVSDFIFIFTFYTGYVFFELYYMESSK